MSVSKLAYLGNRQRTSFAHSDADIKTGFDKPSVEFVDKIAFAKAIKGLEKYSFWDGPNGLWEHQREAIAASVAYLNAEKHLPREGGVSEAALIKMPTGTGKSGVIAVAVRCLSNVRRALVLTPRAALSKQLRSDIRCRFWSHLGRRLIMAQPEAY